MGYDTSSYPNKEEFENQVLSGIEKGAMYRRLICFSNGKNELMQDWFLSQVSADHDKSGNYKELRQAMNQGRVLMLHFPMELDTDYLIVEERGKLKQAIIGFCTGEDVKRALVYGAGIYVENNGAVTDLRSLFMNVLWEKAKEHLREQESLPAEHRCICYSFFDKNMTVLGPK